MKVSELREKSVEQLHEELLANTKEQFNLRLQKGVSQSPQTHLIRNVRRQIARIKTILANKKG